MVFKASDFEEESLGSSDHKFVHKFVDTFLHLPVCEVVLLLLSQQPNFRKAVKFVL